jgi:hypothetical protein
VFKEVDTFEITVIDEDTGNSAVVATITGDSAEGRKERLVPGFIVDADMDADVEVPVATWPNNYNPLGFDNEMVIRKYRFWVPDLSTLPGDLDSKVTIKMKLNPGSSYLPEYDPTDIEDQLLNVFRDNKGFQLYSVALRRPRGNFLRYLAYYKQLNRTLGDGIFPSFSTIGQELFAVQTGASGLGSSIAVFEREREFLMDPMDTDIQLPADYGVSVGVRSGRSLVSFDETTTGLSHNPLGELMAFTTAPGADDQGGLWIAYNDGNGARRLLDPSLSVGAREVAWSPRGDQLVFSSPDYVRVVSFTQVTDPSDIFVSGILVDTPVDSTRTFLTDFHSPNLTFDAGIIVFSARRQDARGAGTGNFQIWASLRTGRIVSPLGVNMPLLGGWDGVDLYDLSINADGDRLLFTANSDVDPNSGTPEPITSRRIWLLDNLDTLLSSGRAPIYQLPETGFVDGSTDPVGGSRTRERRWPRFSLNDQFFAWTGYNNNPDVSSYVPSRIEMAPLPQKANDVSPPTPTPTAATPTPEPTSTPPVPDDANVVFSGEYTFTNNAEGWVFGSAFPTFDAPVGTFTAGSIELRANDSVSSFGFYDSPREVVKVVKNSLYLLRAKVRADARNNGDTPTLRLRVNSRRFESALTAVTNSTGDGTLSPVNGATKEFDLLFRPPDQLFNQSSEFWAYQMSFDLLNFIDTDDPNGALILDGVKIYRLDDNAAETRTTVVKEATTLLSMDLNTANQRSQWNRGGAPDFTEPVFQETPRGLGFRVFDRANTFGFYSLDNGSIGTGTLPASGPVIYRMYTRILSDFENDPLKNPDFRVRLGTSDFQRTVTNEFIVTDVGSMVTPQPTAPATAVTYMVLEGVPSFTSVTAAFDVLSFNTGTISEQLYELDNLVIEQVQIPRYPPYGE